MNIPDKAIEASAKAAYIADNLDWAGAEAAWDDMGGSEPSYERAGWEITVRAAIEAAAPLLMAQAWDEGYMTGVGDGFNRSQGNAADNPYRP